MGNIIGVDCDEAIMDIIGRRIKLGHAVIPGDKFSAGERVAATLWRDRLTMNKPKRVAQMKQRCRRKKLEERRKAGKAEAIRAQRA